MVKIYKFYVSIQGGWDSKWEEEMEIDIPDDATEEETEKKLQEEYDDWLANVAEFTWWEVED